MVLGNTLDIFLKVNVMTKELGKLKRAQAQVSRFSRGASQGASRARQSFGRLNNSAKKAQGRISGLANKFGQFRMSMMSVFFGGLMLLMVFGRLLGLMPGMGAATSALGSAFKVLMMPLSKVLVPALIKLAQMLMKLPKPVRMAISVFVLFMTVIGLIMTVIGGFAMMVAGMVGVFGAALTGAIFVVIGALTAAIATFLAAWAAVKQFGNIVGVILVILGGLIAFFASAPILIAAAIGLILGALWAMRKDIVRVVTQSLAWFGKLIMGIGRWLAQGASDFISWTVRMLSILAGWGADLVKGAVDAARGFANTLKKWIDKGVIWVIKKLRGLIKGLKRIASGIRDAAVDIGHKIIDGIVAGIKAAGDAVLDAIEGLLPFGLSLSDISNAISGGIDAVSGAAKKAGNVIGVNDFVMTPNGQVLDYAPSDYIFGTKNPEKLAGGGGGQNITINFDQPQIDSEVDIDRLMNEVEDRLESNMRGDKTVF